MQQLFSQASSAFVFEFGPSPNAAGTGNSREPRSGINLTRTRSPTPTLAVSRIHVSRYSRIAQSSPLSLDGYNGLFELSAVRHWEVQRQLVDT